MGCIFGKRRLGAALTALSFLLLVGCNRGDGQIPVRLNLPDAGVEIDYLAYFPSGYESGTQKWPLVLFLHGAGQCGTDIEQAKKHGLPQRIVRGADFPFLVISPQSRSRSWDLELLTVLLDDLSDRYEVDLERIYVTGLSMGGFGTWRLATHCPERFAAIAPICGGGDAEHAARLVDLPIWAFHGTLDEVVRVDATRDMVEAVEAAGGSVRYTEYPNAKHDCWTKTYDNPELYTWLLQHKRK